MNHDNDITIKFSLFKHFRIESFGSLVVHELGTWGTTKSSNNLCEVEGSRTVCCSSGKAVSHGRFAGLGLASVIQIHTLISHVNPLMDKVNRTTDVCLSLH